MEINEIKKHFKITKDLNDMLQQAVKITGTTETALMKIALWNLLKEIVNGK